MTAVLPHYKAGPASYQVSALIFGGQLVENTTQTAGTTDLTIKPCVAASVHCLGVAGGDANVLASQIPPATNTYGEPQLDISVLTDFTAVYHGPVDIWVWYSAACTPGIKLLCTANGCVGPAGAGPAADQVVGICTHPGGVAAGQLTQQIGGIGASSFFLGRARIF
jgi:hypothetical protein